MLKLEGIHAHYGHIHALRGVSLQVPDGQIVSLLGSNGAGKSTTLKIISCLMRPKAGSFEIDGESMLSKSSSDLVARGIIHCPEGRRLFGEFTVEENLRIGAYKRKGGSEVEADIEKVCGYFPRLKERMRQRADTLSGGEQQMVAIGRSLMGRPKLLLLDEPSLGIAPKLVTEIFEILSQINAAGTSILLVEQNAYMAMKVSHYSYVLENGAVGLEGDSREMRDNDHVRKLYLGG
ncbi:ABC transporter ATP-binding protein [Salinisphaera aquimarina]|uniref:ABC transporter ATP-binding protein n=1 Tax=Salinisphaera aquimarina TaxID=2094031 RepID=A0ABV7EM75_9GAMM